MTTSNVVKSDLYKLHNIVQNSAIVYPKELILSTLKEYFSEDSYYHYVKDEFGFPKTPDHTGMPLEAGLDDNVTTRLYIGEAFRKDVIFYPALIVRSSGANYLPISINNEAYNIQYSPRLYEDGYGNTYQLSYPEYFISAGVIEGTLTIEVMTRSLRARDDLSEIVALIFQELSRDQLTHSGLFIKRVSIGGPSESDDRSDKLFRQTINLEFRSEWRRHIPILNVIEILNFSIEIGNIDTNIPASPNLAIETNKTIYDIFGDLQEI